MSFLQPWLLAALPLVGLPIVIHLINQQRYQTMRWAAMMFLLAANRMHRGFARLRQWLIMLFRMLVIAGLVFAVSRPLASGWLGFAAGGRADTTIILLDRSPSMQQLGPGVAMSKLETGRQQLVQALEKLPSSRYVLIESTRNAPYELQSPRALLTSPHTEPTSTAASLPAMLQAAYDYVEANQTGRTEVWICSDLRENDWNPGSGLWQLLRDRFLELPQSVRFHVLAYAETSTGNLSVRLTRVQRRQTSDALELRMSLAIRREGDGGGTVAVPVEFEIDGARSVVDLEMTGPQYELKDYTIPLQNDEARGWGRASIPADTNPADNDFYFVFDEPPLRPTIIVADDARAVRPLQLAAGISADSARHNEAHVHTVEQLAAVPWEEIALVLWQTSLPRGAAAERIGALVDRGGRVIFFPPRTPGADAFMGVRWDAWADPSDDVPVQTWRGDQGLLAHALSGDPLPVGKLRVRNYCMLSGECTALARLEGGAPLLARVPTDRGGVYFFATTVSPQDSSLAVDGVALYVAVQRALAAGAAALGNARQLVAGNPPPDMPSTWDRLAATDEALSTDYPFHRGVYAADDCLLAVNRADAEEQAAVLTHDKLAGLFQGLDFARVDDRAGSIHALFHEIWRTFLIAMMVAMVVEAGLCVPKLQRAREAVA